jgi:hypothetical protein
LQTLESAGKPDNRHISEIIAEIMAGVPAEEFAKLPKDARTRPLSLRPPQA